MESDVLLGWVGPAPSGPTTEPGKKLCLGCGRARDHLHFHRQRASPDGYRPRCKECRKASSRSYYEQNAESEKARAKAWQLANRERYLAALKQWGADNSAKKREYDRLYYESHRRERLEYNKTPARREAHRANAKNQKAKRKAAITATAQPITAEQWVELQASYLSLCVYCLEGCDDPTMDHVVPLNGGGDHTADNVVPACPICNRKKSDKPLVVFLTERPTVHWAVTGGRTLRCGPPDLHKKHGGLRYIVGSSENGTQWRFIQTFRNRYRQPRRGQRHRGPVGRWQPGCESVVREQRGRRCGQRRQELP